MENMQKTIKKINKNQETILILYLITLFIDMTVLTTILPPLVYVMKIIRYLCYGFFLIKSLDIYIKSKKKNKLFIVGLIISAIVFIITKNKSLLILLFVLYSSQSINIKALFKKLFKIFFILFFTIVLLSLFKIIPNWQFRRGPLIRYSLGFIYPTDMMSFYLLIVLLYCAVRNNKYNKLDIAIFGVFNIFLYVLSNARMSFLLINIVLLYMFLNTNKKNKLRIDDFFGNKIIRRIIIGLPFFLYILNIMLCFGYVNGNDIAYKVNQLLSNRIKYSTEATKKYSMDPFGEEIEWYGWGKYGYSKEIDYDNFEYNYVDSSYSRIIFDYGYIPGVIIICLYSLLLYNLYKKKKYNYVFIITIVLLWSFVEPIIFNVGRNSFILLFACCLDTRRRLTI